MNKRSKDSGSVVKRTKKSITLETKLEVLRRFQAGEKAAKISKDLGLPGTTVRTIRDRDAGKIIEAARSARPLHATTTMTRVRSAIMVEMESLLTAWIKKQVAQNIPVRKKAIQNMAKSIFEELKSKQVADSSFSNHNHEDENFGASQGWFQRYKVRANLQNVTHKEEEDNFDIEDEDYSFDTKHLTKTYIVKPDTYNLKYNLDRLAVFVEPAVHSNQTNIERPHQVFIPAQYEEMTTKETDKLIKKENEEYSQQPSPLSSDANNEVDFKFQRLIEPTIHKDTTDIKEITTDYIIPIKKEQLDSEEISEQHITSERLSEALKFIDEAIKIFENDDPNKNRSSKVARMITHSISCYEELYINMVNNVNNQDFR